MSYAVKNVNNNDYIKNFKSDSMADDDPASSEACLQNNYNARQLNNGQTVTVRDRCASLHTLFSTGSKRKGVIIVVMATVLLAGIVAICASFVMLGMLGVQRVHISSLESQLEALKAENALCKNETTSLSLQLTACDKELQGAQHQLEIDSAQCELEKGNLTAKFEAEILKGEHAKEIAQEKLNTCEGSKEELSQRLESQTRNAEAEKKAPEINWISVSRRREKSRRLNEEIQQRAAERVAAEAAKASSGNDGQSSWWSSSQSNGAERIGSLQAVHFLSMMLLPLLLKVLHVV